VEAEAGSGSGGSGYIFVEAEAKKFSCCQIFIIFFSNFDDN